MNLVNPTFSSLDPMQVLESIESLGFLPTGQVLQLNSYENRVFKIGIEENDLDLPFLVAKFYRPGRWSEPQIQEEHDFLADLLIEGLPVAAPVVRSGRSIWRSHSLYFSVFPWFRGRMPDELLNNDYYQIGRRLAQLHNVGSQKKFSSRHAYNEEDFYLENQMDHIFQYIAPEVSSQYQSLVTELCELLNEYFDPSDFIRIHGDCHRGNLLEKPLPGATREFFFVDFDDCQMGPDIQDFWMLFSATNPEEYQSELDLILKGYSELRNTDSLNFSLIPLVQAYRIISYSAWIAKRWSDPNFPKLFPNFKDYNYWASEVETLEKLLRV